MLARLEPLVERMNRERPLLLECVHGLTDEEARQRRPGNNYSARETLAHLAGAERGMTRLAQRMVTGQNPRLAPDYSNDYYNARQQEKRQSLSVAELIAELTESRRELLAIMDGLGEEDLAKRGEHPVAGDSDVWGVLTVIVSHERDHTAELEAWADELVHQRK